MTKCPFDDEGFILDINTPCPVCGMLGSFIYEHPHDDSCVGVFERKEKGPQAVVSGSGEPNV